MCGIISCSWFDPVVFYRDAVHTETESHQLSGSQSLCVSVDGNSGPWIMLLGCSSLHCSFMTPSSGLIVEVQQLMAASSSSLLCDCIQLTLI